MLQSLLTHETFANKAKIHPRLHAKNLDKLLGFKIPKIEVKLLQKYRAYDQVNDESSRKQHYRGAQTWIGLHPQALQTPYCDIYQALLTLKDNRIKHIIDIGAGYGRVGLVSSVLFPEAKFTGHEILKQRQSEANRVFSELGIENSRVELKNVLDSDFILPTADIYFIYDFSAIDDVNYILELLCKKSENKKFYLITKGDRIDYLMTHKFKYFWKKYIDLSTSDLKIYTSIN